MRNALPVVKLRGGLELSVPIPQQAGLSDRLKGKLAIFAIFLTLVFFFFGLGFLFGLARGTTFGDGVFGLGGASSRTSTSLIVESCPPSAHATV